MTYNLNELEKNYDIILDIEQRNAISNIISFIYSNDQCICLSGYAGTGKSIILNILYDIFIENGYCCTFVTPTNKAKLVLENKGRSGKSAFTIHSLLNLKPNINILNFDASDIIFEGGNIYNVNIYDILLIDECSMINDNLYYYLCKKYKKSKLIFCGDPKQLYPVKQNHISLPFRNKLISLTKVYRQPDSIMNKILLYLRSKPIYNFKSLNDDYCTIEVYNNILYMLHKYSYLFKISKDFNQLSMIKIITYTNNRIQAINQTVRDILNYTDEYVEGDVIIGYDTISCELYDIENSRDYIICNTPKKIKLYNLDAWELTLESFNNKFKIKILSKNNSEENFNKISNELERLRLKAVRSKSKIDWINYFKFNNSFLTPIDLKYEDRIIRKKSIDYGYCISAHKSQGSEYQIVMLDLENLKRCPIKEEFRQLEYVACSRTKSTLLIYQK